MAAAKQKPAHTGKDLDLKKIAEEVDGRVERAKTEKQKIIDEIREAYSFVMPYRPRPGGGESKPGLEATENFSSIGEEVCTDFASDMADTFIPEHTQWAQVEVADVVPDQFKSDAEAAAKADTDATFAAIVASNFHESGKQCFKDLSVSAVGLAIKDPGMGQPIQCQVVPINELLILRDPDSTVGTRLWHRDLPCREIVELFGDLPIPKEVQAAYDAKKYHERFPVVQGCYRDYSKRAETAWINFTKIDHDVVEAVRNVGVGSAMLLVARWDPDPNFPWGIGCAIKALADFREDDEVGYLKLKGLARLIDPPVAYDDDQVINLEGGLPNGVAIPRMKGSKIEVIESQHDMQSALYARNDVQDRIKRHFYQDGPEQKGLTPPTLGQWADESLQKQRRLGTPAAPLWSEFISEAYMRFRWLLVARGALKPQIRVGGEDFPVRPINPLKRAANQQKAVASERVLASIVSIFGPNLVPMIVDVGATSHNLVALADATGVKLLPADQINQAIAKNQQGILAQHTVNAAAPLLKAGGGP